MNIETNKATVVAFYDLIFMEQARWRRETCAQ
jgi:hypothetical protein